jgi:hypothetical protein
MKHALLTLMVDVWDSDCNEFEYKPGGDLYFPVECPLPVIVSAHIASTAAVPLSQIMVGWSEYCVSGLPQDVAKQIGLR